MKSARPAVAKKRIFSLKNVSELISSTEPALLLHHVDTRQSRYIGYDGGTSEQHPPEMATDKNIAGIVTYGDNQQPAKRLAILGKKGVDYICKSITIKSDDTFIKTARCDKHEWSKGEIAELIGCPDLKKNY
jgi:hypothetical protein